MINIEQTKQSKQIVRRNAIVVRDTGLNQEDSAKTRGIFGFLCIRHKQNHDIAPRPVMSPIQGNQNAN